MTTNALDHVAAPSAQTFERVLIDGDLGKLDAEQRMAFYSSVCKSLGLNPLTKPFSYLTLNGKMTLYALRDATDQLRKLHRVSVEIVERQLLDDLYVVRAKATLPDGRTDESLGALNIKNLRGEARANALMKGETKAKRRVTLSICGLGWLDETEAETIPMALPKDGLVRTEPQLMALAATEEVDTATGELMEPEPEAAVGLFVIEIDDSKKGKNAKGPWTLWRVHFSDGTTFGTFKSELANAAEQAKAQNLPVKILTAGNDLTELTVMGERPPAATTPLTDSDIPFAWVLPIVLPMTGVLSLLV